ncbi:hypothetical protein J4E83_005025 [Alternaria metachromatica]|uniref:uncharacterized protein n=1 Tax=Alternaria metachromatica TaxID=283354 RepID=UPI0020C32780|nr:uncharacterized protein J4E83_005025 [Alternaria metachromatica]KAI4622283.1 hypothetical protein J4E83_005025 [Alternaria metachromatica]
MGTLTHDLSHINIVMKLVSFVVTLYQLFLIAEAAPLELRDDECTQLHSSEATWDPVDKYTIELFQAEATLRPEPNLCLFYTRGLSETARRYAKTRPNGESPMTTIWDVWPKKYYNSEARTTNPLRCIMNNETWRTQYYTNMSKAFASLCKVFATVMDASIGPGTDTPGYVNKGGLWFQAEFPVLQEQNKVLMIDAISPDGKVACTYWTKTDIVQNSIHDKHVYGRGMATGSEAWLDIFSVAEHSLREEWHMGLQGK